MTNKRTHPRNHAIDRITPHVFVGQITAARGKQYFETTDRAASCNWVIGKDGDKELVVPEEDRSWCSSNAANDHRAITMEIASDTKHPYAITDAAYQALIDLCVDICKRYGKTKLLWLGDKVTTLAYEPKSDEMVLTVHRWFAAKACPGDYLMARMPDIASKVTARLQPAKTDEPSPWAKTAWAKAKTSGIMDGTNPKQPMTREQLAVVLHRLGLIK